MPGKMLSWRGRGKCQEYGWARPGDVKQIWHPCHACEGRGWTIPTELPPTATPREYPSIDEMLQVHMRGFFESQGTRFVDITDQVVDRPTPDEGSKP